MGPCKSDWFVTGHYLWHVTMIWIWMFRLLSSRLVGNVTAGDRVRRAVTSLPFKISWSSLFNPAEPVPDTLDVAFSSTYLITCALSYLLWLYPYISNWILQPFQFYWLFLRVTKQWAMPYQHPSCLSQSQIYIQTNVFSWCAFKRCVFQQLTQKPKTAYYYIKSISRGKPGNPTKNLW